MYRSDIGTYIGETKFREKGIMSERVRGGLPSLWPSESYSSEVGPLPM